MRIYTCGYCAEQHNTRQFGGAPDVARTRRVHGAAIFRNPMEKVLCCCLDFSTSADVLIWNHQGPEFKDYEVDANGIVLLTVLWPWGGGTLMQLVWPKRLLSLGGDKKISPPSQIPQLTLHCPSPRFHQGNISPPSSRTKFSHAIVPVRNNPPPRVPLPLRARDCRNTLANLVGGQGAIGGLPYLRIETLHWFLCLC